MNAAGNHRGKRTNIGGQVGGIPQNISVNYSNMLNHYSRPQPNFPVTKVDYKSSSMPIAQQAQLNDEMIKIIKDQGTKGQ